MMQDTSVPCLSSFDLRMTPPPEKEPKLAGPVASSFSAMSRSFTPKSSTKDTQPRPLTNHDSGDGKRTKYPNKSFWACKERCILAPRPYEDIYSERAYLSSSMQTYSARLVEYIREYASLEAKLQQGASGKARRKLRKKVGLMRARISEASQQERAIFNRLGELFLELHSRDLWNAAYNIEGGGLGNIPEPEIESPITPPPKSVSSECGRPSLNPESPVFVPQSKLNSDRANSCERRRVASLETVPELIREEEEEEEDEEQVSLASVKATDDGDDEFVPEPADEDTQGTTGEDSIHKEDSDCLAKGFDNGRWRYVHVLSEDHDIVEEELGGKRWSLPVMRYTWPTD